MYKFEIIDHAKQKNLVHRSKNNIRVRMGVGTSKTIFEKGFENARSVEKFSQNERHVVRIAVF